MVNLKDEAAKAINVVHQAVFTASQGRVGGNLLGMPVLKLTTTGRKSGKKRDTMLTTPLVEGDKVYLVASYGGDHRNPTWFLNLRENPEVEVLMGGRSRRMRASVVPSDRRAELWPRITAKYRNYADYQKQTDREIPLVELTPA